LVVRAARAVQQQATFQYSIVTKTLIHHYPHARACTRYKFIIEPEDSEIIKLDANSPVTGRFTAWQEAPLEKQVLGVTIILVGLTGTRISVIALKKPKS
jgi:hypothetical protein